MSIADILRSKIQFTPGNTVKLQPQEGVSYLGGSPTFNEAAGGQQIGAPSSLPQTPFTGLMNQMPQSGFARPEAQQWMQQALGGPQMAGWGPGWGNAPAAGSIAGASTGGQATPSPSGVFGQLQNIINQGKPTTGQKNLEAVQNFASMAIPAALSGMGGTAGAIGSALGGASALGPLGFMAGTALSVINKYSASDNGWMNTGLSALGDTGAMAEQLGYKKVSRGKMGTWYTGPDGKRVSNDQMAPKLFEQHVKNAQAAFAKDGTLPQKVKSHAGTQAFQALVDSGVYGPEITAALYAKYGQGAW